MYSSIDLFNDPSALLCSLTDGAAAVVLKSAKASSFPSQAPEYYYSRHQVFIVNRSFDFLAPHYVLNAMILLVCVGFLSWSLDSSHGPDIKYIGAPEPTTEEENREEEEEEKPVENISSIDPKADRRRTILKRTRARRLTIENIAKMIEIEDRKRQEVFGSSSSPLDNSIAAMDMGIGGGDVGLNVWSLNQEICLLREINIQLENNGIMVLPKPTDKSSSKKPQQPVDKSSEKKPEITQEQEVLPEESGEFETIDMRPAYSMDKAKKMDLKAHVLLRLRVPLRWVM